MKRILIALLMIMATGMAKAQTVQPTVKVSSLPTRTTIDTGTYALVMEDSAGVKHEYLVKLLSVGAVASVTAADSSILATLSGNNVTLSTNRRYSSAWSVPQSYTGDFAGSYGQYSLVTMHDLDSTCSSAATAATTGTRFAVPIYGASGQMLSNITDSILTHIITILDTMRWKAVPMASNATDNIIVLGANQGTVRQAHYPTGNGHITVTWPGNVYGMTKPGSQGTYGSATTIPVVTVDTNGIVTGVTTATIAAVTSVSATATSPNGTLTVSASVTSPTTNPVITFSASMPVVNGSPGAVGNPSTTVTGNVDAFGRWTAVAMTAIQIPTTSVTGLPGLIASYIPTVLATSPLGSVNLTSSSTGLVKTYMYDINPAYSFSMTAAQYVTMSFSSTATAFIGYSLINTFPATSSSYTQSPYFSWDCQGYNTTTPSIFNGRVVANSSAAVGTSSGIAYNLLYSVNVNSVTPTYSYLEQIGATQVQFFLQNVIGLGNITCASVNGSALNISGLGGAANIVTKANPLTQATAFTINNTVTTQGWGLLKLDYNSAVVDSFGATNTWINTNTQIGGRTVINGTTDDGSNALQVFGNVKLETAGNKLAIATGTNATVGTATLSSGTVTVSNTSVTASSQIYVQYSSSITSTTGVLTTPTITAGASFVITSITPGNTTPNTADNNPVKYWIIN